MLLVILAIWFAYKKARKTGRNPYLWAAIAGAVFIGAQLAVGLGFGVFFALSQEFWGWTDERLAGYNSLVMVPALLASGVALFFLFRYLDKVPMVPLETEPPPPPHFCDLEEQP